MKSKLVVSRLVAAFALTMGLGMIQPSVSAVGNACCHIYRRHGGSILSVESRTECSQSI